MEAEAAKGRQEERRSAPQAAAGRSSGGNRLDKTAPGVLWFKDVCLTSEILLHLSKLLPGSVWLEFLRWTFIFAKSLKEKKFGNDIETAFEPRG